MAVRQKLATEAYWNQVVKKDNKEWRRARNRKALRDFATFVFGLGAIALGIYTVEHTQQYWPDLTGLFTNMPDRVAGALLHLERWLYT